MREAANGGGVLTEIAAGLDSAHVVIFAREILDDVPLIVTAAIFHQDQFKGRIDWLEYCRQAMMKLP